MLLRFQGAPILTLTRLFRLCFARHPDLVRPELKIATFRSHSRLHAELRIADRLSGVCARRLRIETGHVWNGVELLASSSGKIMNLQARPRLLGTRTPQQTLNGFQLGNVNPRTES